MSVSAETLPDATVTVSIRAEMNLRSMVLIASSSHNEMNIAIDRSVGYAADHSRNWLFSYTSVAVK
jgi:hypothetical protein